MQTLITHPALRAMFIPPVDDALVVVLTVAHHHSHRVKAHRLGQAAGVSLVLVEEGARVNTAHYLLVGSKAANVSLRNDKNDERSQDLK